MRHHLYLLLLLILLTVSCSSPQKLYEKGKYFKAFDSVLGDLSSNKKDRKDVLLLNKSFSKMIDAARDEMYHLSNGYVINDLSHNFDQYEKVDTRFVKGRSYINDENRAKYDIFKEDKTQLEANTYDEGNSLMDFYLQSFNKVDARNAYYHFELVKDYGFGYSDINQLLFAAKEAATVIYLIDADLDSDFSYQWDVDRRFDDLEGQEGFVRILYDNNLVQGDCSIELDFSRLDIDERKTEKTQNYTKEVLDNYVTKTDTSGNSTKTPVYKNVSGSVTTVTITKTVSWRIDLEIDKASINCDLKQERFISSVEDRINLFEIRGDERAIPEEFNTSTNEDIKETDEMVELLMDDLYQKVRNYFF